MVKKHNLTLINISLLVNLRITVGMKKMFIYSLFSEEYLLI